MTFERWGALSVADHVDTAGLVANVLLYDRLVVPVATEQPDRDELGYWIAQGWAPDLQIRRLEQLGDLAIRRPWDVERRAQFRSRMDELRGLSSERAYVDAQGMTRRILAHEHQVEKPPGVHHVQVIPAYNSVEGLRQDFVVEDAKKELATQAFLLSRRLSVPDPSNVEDALRIAIDLSRDEEFRAKRADLFDWQERVASRGIPAEAVVEELAAMAEAYNGCVARAHSKVKTRFAFTLFGIGLGFATGGLLGAAAGAALALVQFVTLDRQPAVEAGSATPAAMFHDVTERIGLSLKR
jgi:hypothetical protein